MKKIATCLLIILLFFCNDLLATSYISDTILLARNSISFPADDTLQDDITGSEDVGTTMKSKLPEMDGFETTRIIKDKMPDLPVIIITASVFNGEPISPGYANYDGFVSKPFNLNHLIETIRNILSN